MRDLPGHQATEGVTHKCVAAARLDEPDAVDGCLCHVLHGVVELLPTVETSRAHAVHRTLPGQPLDQRQVAGHVTGDVEEQEYRPQSRVSLTQRHQVALRRGQVIGDGVRELAWSGGAEDHGKWNV